MAVSQNGWAGYSSYGDSNLVSNPTVPGTNVKILGGLNKVAAPVLLWVAAQWNIHVEKLVQEQGNWGFEPRDIRGSTVLSNHASGTAMDLNSALHPLGASGTFSANQVRAIRAILNACDGLVRWGGDYTGRKDEMHVEVNGSAAELAKLGARLLGTSVGLPSTPGAGRPQSPAEPTAPDKPEPKEEEDEDMLQTIQVVGQPGVYAYGPGKFYGLEDPEVVAVGVAAGLWSAPRDVNQREKDVTRAIALKLVDGEGGIAVAK